jgi:hypothetical protein
MAKARHDELHPGPGDCEVSVASADVDLFRRVTAALAKGGHRAQRLRQAIQSAGSSPLKFEDWLTLLGETKQ